MLIPTASALQRIVPPMTACHSEFKPQYIRGLDWPQLAHLRSHSSTWCICTIHNLYIFHISMRLSIFPKRKLRIYAVLLGDKEVLWLRLTL